MDTQHSARRAIQAIGAGAGQHREGRGSDQPRQFLAPRVLVALLLLYSFLSGNVGLKAFTLTNGHNRYNQFVIDNLINKPVASRAKLDLVAVNHATELVGLNARRAQALFKLYGKLEANGRVELVPFLAGFDVKLKLEASSLSDLNS